MTGPRGGKTTVTGGQLRRVCLSLDPGTIARLDAAAAVRGASRSDEIRRLARQLPEPPDNSLYNNPCNQ